MSLVICHSSLFTALRALLTPFSVLILLAAFFFLCAGMSHELHDDAGAFGRCGGALTHVPKVCGLAGGGNTAFRVEFFKDEGRGTKDG